MTGLIIPAIALLSLMASIAALLPLLSYIASSGKGEQDG
nr:MAG TPA: hypothetical protein [Caudoviricetes sp.]